jgi:nucleoside-diphosphate-sugar epimerase
MLYITGTSGFLGGYLLKEFGSEAASVNLRSRERPNRALASGISNIFIHCANSHFDPEENHALTLRAFQLCKDLGCNRMVIFMTFATLTGGSNARLEEQNCGFKPKFLDDYARSKLAQEAHAIQLNVEHNLDTALVYLPAVFGLGGSWDRNLHLAISANSCQLSASPPFNYCSVSDVAECIRVMKADPPRTFSPPRLTRYVVCSPESRETSLAALVDGKCKAPCIPDKLKCRDFVLMYALYRTPLTSALIKFARRIRAKSTTLERDAPSTGSTPLPFYKLGLFYRWLMLNQIHIPGSHALHRSS